MTEAHIIDEAERLADTEQLARLSTAWLEEDVEKPVMVEMPVAGE